MFPEGTVSVLGHRRWPSRPRLCPALKFDQVLALMKKLQRKHVIQAQNGSRRLKLAKQDTNSRLEKSINHLPYLPLRQSSDTPPGWCSIEERHHSNKQSQKDLSSKISSQHVDTWSNTSSIYLLIVLVRCRHAWVRHTCTLIFVYEIIFKFENVNTWVNTPTHTVQPSIQRTLSRWAVYPYDIHMYLTLALLVYSWYAPQTCGALSLN